MKNLLFFSIFFLILGSQTFAHPPSKIDITYDNQSKILKAIITHPVSNLNNHYISKVDVALNGKEIVEQKISFQDSNSTQAVEYYIPDTKSGDVLSVEAYCSISGKLTEKITIK